MKLFARGCQWLIDQYHQLEAGLRTYGFWTRPQVSLAVRLLGADPEIEKLRENGTAYLVALYGLGTQPHEQAAALAALTGAERRPPGLRHAGPEALTPTTEVCRAWLLEHLAGELAEMGCWRSGPGRSRTCRTGQRLLEVALLPDEGVLSRQALRYHKEFCGQFHKAMKLLPKVQAEGCGGGAQDPGRGGIGT